MDIPRIPLGNWIEMGILVDQRILIGNPGHLALHSNRH